jgi:hypothetical protein
MRLLFVDKGVSIYIDGTLVMSVIGAAAESMIRNRIGLYCLNVSASWRNLKIYRPLFPEEAPLALTLPQGTLAGRGGASGTGAAEQIELGTGLSMSGNTLNATGGGPTPDIIQQKQAGTTAASITLDAAPADGHRLICMMDEWNGTPATALSSTNTTWTKIAEKTSANASQYTLWVGVVAGGAGGTTITPTGSTVTHRTMRVVEIADALTPTLGANVEIESADALTELTGITPGSLVVLAGGTDNTTLGNWLFPVPGAGEGLFWGVTVIHLLYAPASGKVKARWLNNLGVFFMAEVT